MLELFNDLELDESQAGDGQIEEYGIDFETGQLNGEVVTGVEALAVWCYFALNIQRYRYRAFSWGYGSETETLIGKNYGRDYTASEIERMVKECVCCHPNIETIENVNITFEGSQLDISFTIISDFGNEEINVELEGAA